MEECLIYLYREWTARLRGEIEDVDMVSHSHRSWLMVCLAFFYPTCLWPLLRIMPLISLLLQVKGCRLSCIARACPTSHSISRLYAVLLLFASSLMYQCGPVRCTHMVLHSILGDGTLIEAFKCWLIRPSYLKLFKGSENKGQPFEWDRHQKLSLLLTTSY